MTKYVLGPLAVVELDYHCNANAVLPAAICASQSRCCRIPSTWWIEAQGLFLSDYMRRSRVYDTILCLTMSCGFIAQSKAHSNNTHPSIPIDLSHRCGHRQAPWREPAGSYDNATRTAICFEHKTQYLLIRAPYTLIVVFWHISKIPPMIGQSQISCNTPTFCIATIFVKYCYTTGSWLL